IKIFAYRILPPIYFILGLAGRLLTLLIIRTEKTEKAYMYQMLVLYSEICEIASFSLYTLSFNQLEIDSDGLMRGSDGWIFLAVYVTVPIQDAVICCTSLLTLSMAIDRIFCLAQPLRYKLLPHRKIQWTVLVFAVVSGAVTSAPLGMMFDMEA